MARICWGRSQSCFLYSFVFQVISEKALCSKDLTRNLREFLYENNRNYSSYKFSYKFAFCPLLETKTRIKFSASWWSSNEKYFCFLSVASVLYFKGMSNLIDFYKRIFLHVIPSHIMVPCFTEQVWEALFLRNRNRFYLNRYYSQINSACSN